ncbi:unnamed protein product [Pleuronectes platessa]|uniref:Uncharacterized protein n=1 Tax=Pleuronectes platessa TaxID=8262 RepID=A0A9N7TKK2_PLEPL|nr:unnamed protein product [Pleuronectes platessa]
MVSVMLGTSARGSAEHRALQVANQDTTNTTENWHKNSVSPSTPAPHAQWAGPHLRAGERVQSVVRLRVSEREDGTRGALRRSESRAW